MKFISNCRPLVFLLFLSLLASTCTKSTDEGDGQNLGLIEGLMTETQIQLNQQLWGLEYSGNWGMITVQYWNNINSSIFSGVIGARFDPFWLGMFTQVLSPLDQVKQLIDETELSAGVKANQKAIADILTIYAFHNLTDAFGDMPYSQTLNSSEFPNPKYDDQSFIYQDLLLSLETAINQIDESSTSYSSGDLIYSGNVRKWKKFGYSLMLRIAMRMADANTALAEQYVKKAVGNTFTDNTDNALFFFSGASSLSNPYYNNFVIQQRDEYVMLNALIDTLTAKSDPRLAQYAMPNDSSKFQGAKFAEFEINVDYTIVSRPNDEVRKVNAPAVMMDYAEVEFLIAEAYQRNMVIGSAPIAFARGITASMNYWDIIDAGAIADYIAANPYDASNWKQSLGVQKWLSLYMNGPQAWAEWRRLDYPELEVAEGAMSTVIPVRLPYPSSETIDNQAELSKVTNDPDNVTTKVWWDVN